MNWLQKNLPLNRANYLLFGIHLIAAIALLGFAFYYKDHDFKIELAWRDRSYQFKARYLVWMAVSFLAITAAFHLWYATSVSYARDAPRGKMYTRWYEYGITATIMAIIIAIVSGVDQVLLLVTLGALAVGIMSTGLWFENVFDGAQQYVSFVPLVVGFGLLAALVFTIFVSYRDRVNENDELHKIDPCVEKVPDWVTWIVIGTLAFYGVFGLVPLVRWYTGWDPIWFEYAYLFLSATAKLYLGAFLGYGVLRRSEAESEPKDCKPPTTVNI